MKVAMLATACVFLTPASVFAAEKPASAAQIKQITTGHDVNIGGATGHYGIDGSYTYNGQNPGHYKVSKGRICINFDAGGSRCDRIVVDGATYTLINKNGDRYPFGP